MQFYYWKGLIPLKLAFPILSSFNFQRIHWLQPFLWFLVFAASLSIILSSKYGKILTYGFIILHFFYICNNGLHEGFYNELKTNYKMILDNTVRENKDVISYRAFISKDLFKEIKEFINKPQNQYRIASIGIHPSVSQFNGFYTIDSYQNNYLLSYKHKFRKIIEKELDKNARWQKAFDYWGNRCYLMVNELTRRYSKPYKRDEDFESIKDIVDYKISNLELNIQAFQDLNGSYIFSIYEIMNAEENDLMLLKVFEDNESVWRIFLYQVKRLCEN